MKSLRSGKATIAESYAASTEGRVFLVNATSRNICRPTASTTSRKRPRKLLLKSRQINKLAGVEREGMTIVPLKIYFNERGRAKVEIAVARGKKLHDKRETEKQRDWSREKGRRLLKTGG